MKSFMSYIKGEKYDVGCTGGAVCVYDKDGQELKVFKGLKNAYDVAFVPNTNNIVVKTAEGTLAVFSLDRMSLLKKIRFSQSAGQEYGFCFSKDGKLFYNIEVIFGIRTQLTVYDTATFTPIKKLFDWDEKNFLNFIETYEGGYVLFGYERGADGVFSHGFAAQFDGEKIIRKSQIALKDCDYVRWYKQAELRGFTKKMLQWSPVKADGNFKPVKLYELL